MGPEGWGGAKFSRFFSPLPPPFSLCLGLPEELFGSSASKTPPKIPREDPQKERENKRVKFVTGEGKIAEFGAANLAQNHFSRTTHCFRVC